MPNVLLVYSEFPVSYWGFQFAMDFIGRGCFPKRCAVRSRATISRKSPAR